MTEASWHSLGAWLQLVGIAVVAYGVLEVREELDPDHSALAAARAFLGRWGSWARTRWTALRQSITRLRRDALDVWNRWRGRPTPQRIEASGLSISAGGLTGSLTGMVSTPPAWDDLKTANERITELRRRTEQLDQQFKGLDTRQRSDATRLEHRIDEARHSFENLHLGGLTREGWGAALLATGTAMTAWPGTFADSNFLHALVFTSPLAAVLWYVTSEQRRWWPSVTTDS